MELLALADLKERILEQPGIMHLQSQSCFCAAQHILHRSSVFIELSLAPWLHSKVAQLSCSLEVVLVCC